MLVKFDSPWASSGQLYINPLHVKSVHQLMIYYRDKYFHVAGQVRIEFIAAYEGDCLSETVVGTLEEVAAKLNGDSGGKPVAFGDEIFSAKREGMAEAWSGAATHPGLPADIADAFHVAARRMRVK